MFDTDATREQREPPSLFGEILDWMLAPLLVLWPMSIFLTYLVAQNIAATPYDAQMADTVLALARHVQLTPGRAGDEWRTSLRLNEVASGLLRADESDEVYYQVLGARGEFVTGDASLPVPEPQGLATGVVHFREAEAHGMPVRMAYLWLARPGDERHRAALVQLAETLNKRKTLANEIIKGVILPQFIILPTAVVLVWFALGRGMKPLKRLQQRIRRREAGDLSPIDDHGVPAELGDFVRAINDVLERLNQSMSQQRHFLADAAHQLKTPLAGLRTQAEFALREIDAGAGDAESLKRSLQQIAVGSQRAAHMVNQLLSMARAENREAALRKTDFNLAELVREVVEDFVPKALDKRIDLGYEGPQDASLTTLRGLPVLMREMLRNLVDNALQYTPSGGTVTARITADPFGQVLVLQVEDNGPGIPEAEREFVFQPFYRALGTEVDGTGLGLAIVQEVAQQHGAEVSLSHAHDRAYAVAHGHGPGALFTVRIPLARGAG